MHELSLAQDVLHKVLLAAQKQGLKKIHSAKVSIGETLITDPVEFKELFESSAKGTPAEGIQLEFEITPLKAICDSCKKDFSARALRFDCPHCGSTAISITGGKELEVIALN